jgi:hypothetical protein
MIIRYLLVPAVGAAMACAAAPVSTSGGTAAQPRASAAPPCTTPDDSVGTSMSGVFASRPEPLYAAGSATLRELGYAVLEHVPPRELITAPSYAWPKGTENEGWHGSEHPGVELFLYTRPAGTDSTQVTIGARALCKVRGPGETTPSAAVGTSLESVSMLAAMNAFLARLQRGP